MGKEDVEEIEKPFVLVESFSFHITIAFCGGWLSPRYLIII